MNPPHFVSVFAELLSATLLYPVPCLHNQNVLHLSNDIEGEYIVPFKLNTQEVSTLTDDLIINGYISI
jgi:hypothetical protein